MTVATSARDRWGQAARRAGTHSLAIWAPATLAFLAFVALRSGSLSFDLAHAYLPAADRVLAGESPYPPATVEALAPRTAFVYPPLTAWLVSPLAVLPAIAAELAGFALMVVAVVAALLLLDVRDWRCHLIVFLWVPTFSAIQTAGLALPIAVGLAALWRLRNRRAAPGLLAGLLVALKLYVWPVGIWLLATRRLRQAALAALCAPVLVLASWAAIGFAGLREYPDLLRLLTRLERGDGYTIAALLAPATSWPIATAVGVAAGLAALAAAWWCARGGNERLGFVYAIAATLMLTPILWMSYFVVLLVAIGVCAPRFGWLWTLPLALWVGPQVSNGAPVQTATVLLVVGATLFVAIRAAGPHPRLRGRAPARTPRQLYAFGADPRAAD